MCKIQSFHYIELDVKIIQPTSLIDLISLVLQNLLNWTLNNEVVKFDFFK